MEGELWPIYPRYSLESRMEVRGGVTSTSASNPGAPYSNLCPETGSPHWVFIVGLLSSSACSQSSETSLTWSSHTEAKDRIFSNKHVIKRATFTTAMRLCTSSLPLFSNWHNWFHENGRTRHVILFVRNSQFTCYRTSSRDEIETSVSANFTPRVACDRTTRILTDFSCVVRSRSSDVVVLYYKFVASYWIEGFTVQTSSETGCRRFVYEVGFMRSVAPVGEQL